MWINSNGAHTCDIGPFSVNITGGSSNWDWIVSGDGWWSITSGSANSLESAKREALAAVTEQIDNWSSQVRKATPKSTTIDTVIDKLPETLRVLRRAHDLTLAAVGTDTGLSISFLSDIERGRTRPSLDTLEKLARCYNVWLRVTL